MCAQCRRTDVLKQLLRIMPAAKVLLSVTNNKGNTVLHEAASTGIVEMAMLILEKELDNGGDQVLISVPNLNGETPIYWAAMYGHKDMLLFLDTTANNCGIRSISTSMVGPLTMRTDGSTILHAVVLVKSYDVAMEIMEIYPDPASYTNGDGATAMHILAQSPSSFKSGTTYFHNYFGATPFVFTEIAAAITYAYIPIDNYETRNATTHTTTVQPDSSFNEKFKHYFRRLCRGFPVLKLIYSAKQKHNYAIQLLRKLLEKDCGQWTTGYGADIPHGWDDKYNNLENRHPLSAITTRVNTYRVRERPIILATKLGIVEMLKEIIEVYPKSIEFCDEDAGRNLLHLAAEYRHEPIIDFLKTLSTISKRNLEILVTGIDRDGNTPLHAAAKLGKHKPWHVRGAAQWMQWECVWFQIC
ncbi:uncharacterized protein LOC113326022 [Papaver somniferum]|uniref:uncharacterized protein LOC113326022 n=1 Tax=Papaver somniferum TaxID=3469 RepID=UPI000E6FD4F5|nr:uncharacterized protein LOC113326022 [Papaver somniferum]